ncbi:ATP-binding protein [Devosia riboflavina]
MVGQTMRVLSISVQQAGATVCVVVADTGVGIPSDAIGSIFDPFFSTKGPGKGLGLGLSISYGLVRDLGGSISAESVQGRGARFTMILPLARLAVSTERQRVD